MGISLKSVKVCQILGAMNGMCPPQIQYVEALIPTVMVFSNGVIRFRRSHDGEVLNMGLVSS